MQRMQHKRVISPFGFIKLALGLALVVGIASLMTANIPAPQHPIEKELDAKAFLEQPAKQ